MAIKYKHLIGKLGFSLENWDKASDTDYNYKRIKTLPLVIRSKRGLAERLETLRRVSEANVKNKLYDKNQYHWGLVNGIIYSLAVLDGIDARKVKYIECTTKAKLIKNKSRIILPK